MCFVHPALPGAGSAPGAHQRFQKRPATLSSSASSAPFSGVPPPSRAHRGRTWAPFPWPSSAVWGPGSPSPSGAASPGPRSAWPGLARPGGLQGKRERAGPVGGRAGSPSHQGQARLGSSRVLWASARTPCRPSARAARPREALLTLRRPQQLQAAPEQGGRHDYA